MRKLLFFKRIAVILFLLISINLFLGCGNSKQTHDIAKALADLDSSNHSPEQFLAILNELHKSHPNYSRLQIADAITRIWSGFKNVGKDISVYTVAADIKQLSEKYPGTHYAEILINYVLFRAKRH